jgi:membrane-anchored glycerophosphoryl diester phosphodiesterase (GDPDase)
MKGYYSRIYLVMVMLARMAAGQVEMSDGTFRVRVSTSQKMLSRWLLLVLLLLDLVLVLLLLLMLQAGVMDPGGVRIVQRRLRSLRPQIQRLLMDLQRRHGVTVAH